jgi:TatA/E family protein of Tat protein translocase
MGIESPVHLIFVAVIALVVLGPKRLPDLAKALGQGIREFRESLDAGASGAEHSAPPLDGVALTTPAPPEPSTQAPSDSSPARGAQADTSQPPAERSGE